ncbi:MAG: TIGR04290 family methyltransferase [Verrucomicrobiota bacterium]|nr:TIGR04290 family methyltransferase [Verrucomicrobiota bacterium]
MPSLTPDATRLSKAEIERRVRQLGPWFHNLNLAGIQTAPQHFLGDYPAFKFRNFSHAIPSDLAGKTVLDIGCNAGFYSMEMKRRGAERVVAIDFDETYLAQAKFAAEVLEYDIEFQKLSVYDVGLLGEKFDLVIFMGVLYHLRHPLLALDLIHEHVTKDLLLFQSMQRGSSERMELQPDYPFSETGIFEQAEFPRMYFIEKSYSQDPTNWWIPNRACVEGMLRSAGYQIVMQAEEEVYLARHVEKSEENGAVYPGRKETA